MTSVKELLWLTLEDLKEEEFKQLKWLLQQVDIINSIVQYRVSCPAIPVTRLENADRQDTVDQMVQAYGLHGALEVTRGVLSKIGRNDLVQRLVDITPTSAGTHSGNKPASSEIKSPPLDSDLMVPVPKPPVAITSYQQILQSNLQNRFMCVHEGISEVDDKKLLRDIYTELYITDGGNMQLNKQHEVMQMEMSSMKRTEMDQPVRPCDIFKHPSGKYRPIRMVLTNGIAGIGKTFLLQKFILDWSEGRTNQDVHLVFPFTFRQLNLLKGKRFCLAKLIHKCILETKDIKEAALSYIFSTLQVSGNTNYDKSKFKLLFVLDGLDENRLQLDFTDKKTKDIDVTKSSRVEKLLTNLIKGTLLPSCRVWITTRPAAADQVSLEFVDIVSEVRGFTDAQKEEYFIKRFSGEEYANKVISHVKASCSLKIMCYIPVFCWITATVLEDVLKSSNHVELPKTLTEMYTEFLAFQMIRTKDKYGTKKSMYYIQSLARLAFHQLEKGNIIFYEKDLKDSGINLSEASLYSGVFTQVFKREHWRKKDKDKGRMFSFIHLSIQEFLAAFYVQLLLVHKGRNVMAESQATSKSLGTFFSRAFPTDVHRTAIDKALVSPQGHLDLFLRFLLGLSMQANRDLLGNLLRRRAFKEIPRPVNNEETIHYIKAKLRENHNPERSINLLHCLNELNDHSLVEEIQEYLNSGNISQRYLSPAQWSALVFILLSSEKKLEVFDLKKYSATQEGFLRLLPVFQTSAKYLLSGCNLTERSFNALSSVLMSEQSNLRELDLSSNNPGDLGVAALCAGLKSPHCRLSSLRLSDCSLSESSCEALALVLSCGWSRLRVLDLSNNNLQDSGVKVLCDSLQNQHCKLQTLRLSLCELSWVSCESLASVLSSESSCLRHLDLSNNDLQDPGVRLISAALQTPGCRLKTLSLSACLVTEEGCASLASALTSDLSQLRELDLSYNDPGASGAMLLSDCRLETVILDPRGERWLKSGLKKYACDLTLDLNTAHRELVLSENNRRVTRVREKQPYPDHSDRFDWFQVLCREALTGRCYWEVEWKGRVWVAVTYRGIGRRGEAVDCCLGWNDKSWCLDCTNEGYYMWHNKSMTNTWVQTLDTTRVGVYLDCQAGHVSFYRVSAHKRSHLHTFYSTFTEALYPGFWLGRKCTMALCRPEDEETEERSTP